MRNAELIVLLVRSVDGRDRDGDQFVGLIFQLHSAIRNSINLKICLI
jgi:hypothetical protein